MKIVNVLSACSIGLWSACAFAAPTPPATPPYAAVESKPLTLCMTLAIDAYTIAGYKLHGEPASVPKQFFSSDPQANVIVPMVDTVYGDDFTDAWDYAGVFYQDCADKLGKVTLDRSGPAAHCMYRTLIAATARTARAAGTAKDKVYALYVPAGAEGRKIIDSMYAPAVVPAQGTELQTWGSCMAPLVAPQS